jgi:hypothetical protein
MHIFTNICPVRDDMFYTDRRDKANSRFWRDCLEGTQYNLHSVSKFYQAALYFLDGIVECDAS